MQKISILLLAAILGTAAGSQAQSEGRISQSMYNKVLANPGYAGSERYGNLSVFSRSDFSSVADNGQFQAVGLSFAAGKKVGVGAVAQQYKIGKQHDFSLYGIYAYHLKLSNDVKLSLALRPGFAQSSIKLSDVDIYDPSDPVFASDQLYRYLRVGVGMYLYGDNFYAGITNPYLLNKRNDNMPINANESAIDPKNVQLVAGYDYVVNNRLALRSSLNYSYLNNYVNAIGNHGTMDVGLTAVVYSKLWLGVQYSSADQLTEMLAVDLGRQWRLGYALVHNVSPNVKSLNGGFFHELMLSFNFGYDTYTKTSPRYF